MEKEKKMELRKPVKFRDGFSVSIQASRFHYCTPREDSDLRAFYSAVECGFPNKKEVLLMPYAEDRKRPTKTVYAWVPREIIFALCDKHGGCGDQLDWLGIREVKK